MQKTGSCGKHVERGSSLGREKHPDMIMMMMMCAAVSVMKRLVLCALTVTMLHLKVGSFMIFEM